MADSNLPCHTVRDSLGTAVYFTTYETTKQFLGNIAGLTEATPPPAVSAIAGGLCGIMGWIVVCPCLPHCYNIMPKAC